MARISGRRREVHVFSHRLPALHYERIGQGIARHSGFVVVFLGWLGEKTDGQYEKSGSAHRQDSPYKIVTGSREMRAHVGAKEWCARRRNGD
jgi:hypothetical protein